MPRATFHVTLQGGKAMIAPETSVAQIAVEDTATGGKAFAAISAGNVASLTWQTPTSQEFTTTKTLVFRRNDGSILKIGNMTLNLIQGTITFAYAEVTP